MKKILVATNGYILTTSPFILGIFYFFLVFAFIWAPSFYLLMRPIQTITLFTIFLFTVIWRGLNGLEAFSPLDEYEVPNVRENGDEKLPVKRKTFSKKRWTLPILWLSTLGMIMLAWDGIGSDFVTNPYFSSVIFITFFGTLWYRYEQKLPPFTLSSL